MGEKTKKKKKGKKILLLLLVKKMHRRRQQGAKGGTKVGAVRRRTKAVHTQTEPDNDEKANL